MHERYGFIYEMLSVALLFVCSPTVWAFGVSLILSLMNYGTFLVVNDYSLLTRSFVAAGIFLAYSYLYYRHFLSTEAKSVSAATGLMAADASDGESIFDAECMTD